MDPKQELSVIFGTSQQAIVDKILLDLSTTPFDASVRVLSRTAYKGYVKSQKKMQKKPSKRTPPSSLEK